MILRLLFLSILAFSAFIAVEAQDETLKRFEPLSGGVVNGKAVVLIRPPYPAAARAVRAEGAVNVQVTIDEQGKVISAEAVSGHPLLRAAAVKAAQASSFTPTTFQGTPVKVTGIIVYNFVGEEPSPEVRQARVYFALGAEIAGTRFRRQNLTARRRKPVARGLDLRTGRNRENHSASTARAEEKTGAGQDV